MRETFQTLQVIMNCGCRFLLIKKKTWTENTPETRARWRERSTNREWIYDIDGGDAFARPLAVRREHHKCSEEINRAGARWDKFPIPASLKCLVLSPPHFERQSDCQHSSRRSIVVPETSSIPFFKTRLQAIHSSSSGLSPWNESRLASLGCWLSFSVGKRDVCLTKREHLWIVSFDPVSFLIDSHFWSIEGLTQVTLRAKKTNLHRSL